VLCCAEAVLLPEQAVGSCLLLLLLSHGLYHVDDRRLLAQDIWQTVSGLMD